MAKSTLTENEKTVVITIFAGLLLVAGWTGYASILGFTGSIVLTTTVSAFLAGTSALMVLMMGAWVVVIRKA